VKNSSKFLETIREEYYVGLTKKINSSQIVVNESILSQLLVNRKKPVSFTALGF